MGQRTRCFDWSLTSLGPAADWPQALKIVLRLVLDAPLPSVVWWGEGLVAIHNDACIPLLGSRHPEALGRPAAQVWASLWPVLGPLAQAVLAGGRALQSDEIAVPLAPDPSREAVRVTFSLSPIPDGRGGVGGVFGMCLGDARKDIAERKRIEAALREADRRKDTFLATLAHELRNPLAPLRTGIEILRLGGRDPQTLERALGMMDRQLGQMTHLVDDLLDLSRIGRDKIELRRQRVDLAAILRSALETSRPQIESRQHALQLELPEEVLPVDADQARLAQVFANLLNNAAKYTDPGGRIAVRAVRAGGRVSVTVEDTGIGIPARTLPRIFELYIQEPAALANAQGGLGIGLYLVRRLTEMHGGTVEARSAGPGQGSAFEVTLPLAPTAGAGERSGIQAAPRENDGQRRILVVDDSRDVADSLGLLLELMGNETRVAYGGPEALDAAEVFRPDLVLLDIGMPYLNGYETAGRMRQRPWGAGIVLVALTGFGHEEDRRRSREAGFDWHLVKPVDARALKALLARL